MVWMRKRTTSTGHSYSVQWREDGRIHSVTFSDGEKAKAERFKSLVHGNGDRWPPGYRETLLGASRRTRTIRGQILHFIETNNRGSKGWRGESRRVVERYLPEEDALANMPIERVIHSDVLAWVRRLIEKPLSPKTVANAHALLSGALKLAVKDGDLDANPAAGAGPRSDAGRPGPALTQEEFATIVALMPDDYQVLVTTLGRTGMRWGEVTALTWEHAKLDATRPYLDVRQAWKETERRGHFEIGPPKTRRGERRVYLDADLAAALREHRPDDAQQQDWIFISDYGNPVRSNNFHYRIWRPRVLAAAEAGLLSFTPRIHDLRHAHATWLLESGQPVSRVAYRLGHDPAVLMGTYSHLMDQGAAETALAVEAMFDDVSPREIPEGFIFELPSQRRGPTHGTRNGGEGDDDQS